MADASTLPVLLYLKLTRTVWKETADNNLNASIQVDLLQIFVFVSINNPVKFKLETYRSSLYHKHSGVRGTVSEKNKTTAAAVITRLRISNNGELKEI